MDSASQTRLFLTLWPDAAVRHALQACRDDWDWPPAATLVAPEKLHLTLHFLGAIDTAHIPDLRLALRVPFAPFTLSFGVPKRWQHGVAVLEPHTSPPELLSLHARLSAALVGLGLQPEARAYRPHVTLAHRAEHAAPAPAGPCIQWPVTGYALVASTPQRDHGGTYTVLHSYPT